MRTIYLIRHGKAEQPAGGRRCIGRTDLPLSPEGEAQAHALGRWLEEHPVTAVYCSPLTRARKTAELIAEGRRLPVVCVERLQELSVGAWEGQTFSDIRERWPDRYEARGQHLATCAPPGGETFLEGGRRLQRALRDILRETQGDIMVISHSGVIRGMVCPMTLVDYDRLMELPQPCGGITTLREQDGILSVVSVGRMPSPWPDAAAIDRLQREQETPDAVIAHERAVASRALELARSTGAQVNLPLLEAACLLHDVCRASGREHPSAAARLLMQEGYPELADIISRHHDLGSSPCAEAELLFLADKLTNGTEPITIEERFERSRQKCRTEEALRAWQSRRYTAMALAQRYGLSQSKGDTNHEADEN